MDNSKIRGKVALVGAPSTGKSTLFNRIIGERRSIVSDEYGITRDRIYSETEWLGQRFILIDTGGIEKNDAPFQKEIKAQVELAIDEADLVIFLTDGKVGITSNDEYVVKELRKAHKPLILAVNKIDEVEKLHNAYDFYSLGVSEVIPISAAHGVGIGDLLDKIIELLPEEKEIQTYPGTITFALIGRPNVGKSSLYNAIIGEKRTIVSPIAGTTRDDIDTAFKRDETNYIMIDTAGLKRRGKIYEAIDKFAAIRSYDAVKRAEIVLLVVDASEGIVEQDKHVVSLAIEEKKPVIIVVNKWDLHTHNQDDQIKFTIEIKALFKFLDYAPVVYVSALQRKNLNAIFKEIDKCYEDYNKRVPTSILNDIILEAQIRNQAPDFNGGRLKINYCSQVKSCPPTFVLFVNNPRFMHFSYERYIENTIRETFDIKNTPISIICRAKRKEI